MEKWIEILKSGDYPQGNISNSMLKQIADNYDPSYIQAPFIPRHRQFNDKGELINNEAAIDWIKAVKASDGSLYALFENEDAVKEIYDGKKFKYASVEIQTENINGKEVAYLGALAATNFPASKIQQIKFNDSKVVKVYSNQFKIEEQEMKPEQLKQLCKVLGIKEDSTPEEVVIFATQLAATIKDNDAAAKLAEVIKLIKVEPAKKESASGGENPDIAKLTASIEQLTAQFSGVSKKLEAAEDEKVLTVFNEAVVAKKLLPSQKDEMLKTFAKNPEGLKTFASKLPVIKTSASIEVPKDEAGKPMKYSQLLKDAKAYADMKKHNPELLDQLRAGYLADPKEGAK